MSTFRKLLMSLVLVSLTGTAFGAGTFASFTASTTNATSTFATGSIVLSNKVNTGTACFSTGIAAPGTGTFTNGNVNNNCTLLFNTSPTKPGDVATADIEILNAGDLDASDLTLSMDADPGAGTTCVTADAAGTNFHGNGDLCGSVAATALQVTLQEWPDAAHTANAADPDYRCLFDSDGANDDACGATGGVLNTFDDWTTLAPLSIGTVSKVASAPANTRWFTITFTMPNGAAGAENAVMGRKVDFTLAWTLKQ